MGAVLALPAESRPAAIERLFTDLERAGGPLIEPRNEGEAIVTFLWKGNQQTTSVVVVTPSTLYDFAGSVMTRIEGTDAWYRSLVASRSARFAYRFEVNGPLTPFDQDPQFFRRSANWISDPLNPRTFVHDTGDSCPPGTGARHQLEPTAHSP